MQCPKCGEKVVSDAVICARCDYILDTGFLAQPLAAPAEVEFDTMKMSTLSLSSSSGGDAIMLGNIDEEVALMWSEHTGSFLTADSAEAGREIVPAPVYVSKGVQELMKPEAVLLRAPDLATREGMLSPFELHVLSFVDGRRPVARLRKKTGLSSDDLRIAVGMLADKGAVILGGFIKNPLHELGDDSDDDLPGGLPADVAADVAALPSVAETDDRTEEWVAPKETPVARPVAPQVKSPVADALPWMDAPAAPVRPPLAPRAPAVVDDAPARAAGFFELATAELAKGNRVRAHVYAKLAIETNPDEPKYQAMLQPRPPKAPTLSAEATLMADADEAERHGNSHKAVVLLQQVVQLNPSSATALNRLGILLATKFKRFSEASELLLRAVELQPQNAVFKNNFGKIVALAQDRESKPAKADHSLLGALKKAFER